MATTPGPADASAIVEAELPESSVTRLLAPFRLDAGGSRDPARTRSQSNSQALSLKVTRQDFNCVLNLVSTEIRESAFSCPVPARQSSGCGPLPTTSRSAVAPLDSHPTPHRTRDASALLRSAARMPTVPEPPATAANANWCVAVKTIAPKENGVWTAGVHSSV